MLKPKKITVDVPEQLLKTALAQTNKGISETVRAGLQLIAASSAYARLFKLRGKVKLAESWQQLKEDEK